MNIETHLATSGLLRKRKITNVVMMALSILSIILITVPLLWILIYVFKEGLPALTLDFFTKLPTPVGVAGGGIANSLVGSLITVGLGLLISIPIGLLTGFYVAARSNSLMGLAIRFGTDVISGVPSIVMGIFAYTIVVLPQKHFSAFSGGVVLSFIMLPIIIRTTEDMIRLVPRTLNEGSLALGASEWKTQISVILPAAANGVITGVMLAIARAAGEAAPMLFTSFGNPFMNLDISQPIATLPHTIFVYAISPYQDWHAKAWATAAVLILLVFLLNVTARLFVWWRERQLGSIMR
jgi:phosphate transport system permease protein